MPHDTVAYVMSPGHPAYYPTQIDCMWRFSSIQEGFYIVRFIAFEVMNDGDKLIIGEGAVDENKLVLNLDAWYHPNSLTIQHRKMWVRFLSNDIFTVRGFFIEINRTSSAGLSIHSLYNKNRETWFRLGPTWQFETMQIG